MGKVQGFDSPVELSFRDALTVLDDPDRDYPILLASRKRSGGLPVSLDMLTRWVGPKARVIAFRSVDDGDESVRHGGFSVHSGAVRVVGAPDVENADCVYLTRFAHDVQRLPLVLPGAISRARQSLASGAPTRTDQPVPGTPQDHPNLVAEMATAQARITQLTHDLTAANSALDTCRREHTDPVFEDDEEQFRSDATLAWLRMTPPSERAAWPMREYQVGPDFLGSWDDLSVDRARVVHVVVDMLTRRAYEMSSRAVHPQGETRGGKPTTRADGAIAYRAAIKRASPSAPRLLVWELCDGRVELARVALHDDLAIR